MRVFAITVILRGLGTCVISAAAYRHMSYLGTAATDGDNSERMHRIAPRASTYRYVETRSYWLTVMTSLASFVGYPSFVVFYFL
jgi:hypothetical protein